MTINTKIYYISCNVEKSMSTEYITLVFIIMIFQVHVLPQTKIATITKLIKSDEL